MKIIDKIKNGGISIITLLIMFSSCNKLNTVSLPLAVPTTPAGNTVAKVIAATPSDSLFYRLLIKSGLIATSTGNIADSTLRFTVFVPDNNAMKVFINGASGGAVPLNAPDAVFSGFITANLPVASAVGIASYHIVPQVLTTNSFPTSINFPNLQYPTILNPAPTLSALLRLTTFPSKRGVFTYDNNVPLSSSDVVATNGIIHHVAAVVVPPSASLWVRISADADMTYYKAAVQRADSGVAVTSASSLQGALDNIGANLTVFVPTDSSFRSILTGQITLALIAQGMPPANAQATAAALAATPAVFTNPALSAVLTPTNVKGIVVYHILGTRAFTVNLPTTQAYFPTLLNGGIPTHPGVGLQASFTGPVVSAATAKGVGNATAATLLLNPTPGTGTSDQNATNGVLHKINMVLLPQ